MFSFKQFAVRQSGSAMKVGTDGVLIGAWCDCGNDDVKVLDIGTGTGLISLMIAQRNSSAIVTAIEIDSLSVEQARENFEKSPWKDRLTVEHLSVQNFAMNFDLKYGLIVSNPPYFTNSLKCPKSARTMARHDDSLMIEELVRCVDVLIAEDGLFVVILPYDQRDRAIIAAGDKKMYLNRACEVFSTANSALPKRVIMEFSRQNLENPPIEKLIIELSQRHEYSEDCKKLTSDFYLKF